MPYPKNAIAAALAATILGTAAFEANALPLRPNTINIGGDRGGKIIKYAIKVKKAQESGKKVRFRGSCDSACTLYLSLPKSQTCISPGARFKFHRPYGSSARTNRAAANYMIRQYPGWVRSWISKNGGLTTRLITMDYAYASRFIPACEVRTASRRTKNSFSFSRVDRVRKASHWTSK